MRPHGTQEQLERRRRQAMQLLDAGMSLAAIAKQLKCYPSAVCQWRDLYRRKGAAGLAPKPIPGRPHRLSRRHRETLGRLLVKGAFCCGYSTDLWTTRRVTEVIRKRFGISYHPNHLWRLLRGLGFSCQRPATRARERDEEAIERWKRTEWPRLKKSPKTWRPSPVSR